MTKKQIDRIYAHAHHAGTEDSVPLQTQCAWCKKMKVGSRWVFSAPVKGVLISHGMCPECHDKFRADNKRES